MFPPRPPPGYELLWLFRLTVGVTDHTQPESASSCFASSSLHSAVCLSFQAGSAAVSITRGVRNRSDVRDILESIAIAIPLYRGTRPRPLAFQQSRGAACVQRRVSVQETGVGLRSATMVTSTSRANRTTLFMKSPLAAKDHAPSCCRPR